MSYSADRPFLYSEPNWELIGKLTETVDSLFRKTKVSRDGITGSLWELSRAE